MSDRPAAAPGMFGFLAMRLSASPEDVATEALVYILRISTAACWAFEDYCRRIGPLANSLHYVAQSRARTGLRPT